MTEVNRRKKRKRIGNSRRFFAFLLISFLCFLIALSVVRTFGSRIYPPPEPTEFQIAYNRTEKRRGKRDIQYIVIHDTANKSRGADAVHHYRYFNSGNHGSSADFFVDDDTILRINDFYSYYTWHCGDGNGRNGITNQNSIGVEICVNRDGNYKQALANAASLVKNLMEELGIDISHVVRHYDASGKSCPAEMEDSSWNAWEEFKKSLL